MHLIVHILKTTASIYIIFDGLQCCVVQNTKWRHLVKDNNSFAVTKNKKRLFKAFLLPDFRLNVVKDLLHKHHSFI